MNPYSVIALCSLGISILTFIAMLIGQRHTAATDFVQELEGRIERLEADLEIAERKIHDLEAQNGTLIRENLELLRKLALK